MDSPPPRVDAARRADARVAQASSGGDAAGVIAARRSPIVEHLVTAAIVAGAVILHFRLGIWPLEPPGLLRAILALPLYVALIAGWSRVFRFVAQWRSQAVGERLVRAVLFALAVIAYNMFFGMGPLSIIVLLLGVWVLGFTPAAVAQPIASVWAAVLPLLALPLAGLVGQLATLVFEGLLAASDLGAMSTTVALRSARLWGYAFALTVLAHSAMHAIARARAWRGTGPQA
jgi:hypothetical protein